MSQALEEIIQKLGKIPEPPKAAIQAINMLEDSNTPVVKVSEFISLDETLTLKLLRLANSSYYGFHTKITTVKEAIVRLGVNVVKCSLYASMLEVSGMTQNAFFYELWKSSLFTAFLAKEIGMQLGYPRKDICFTAGLLVDIGQILLNNAADDIYPALVVEARDNDFDIKDAEIQVFGFSHQDIGNKLAEHWKLPLLYQNAIHFHHEPATGVNNVTPEEFKLLMAVHIANQMTPLFTQNPRQLELDMALLKQFGIVSTSGQFVERFESQFNGIMLEVAKVSEMMFGASAASQNQMVA